MALVFTKGATVVTLTAGRRFPIGDTHEVNVVVDYAEGRQAYCYDKGVTEYLFLLDFHNMDAVDYAALQSFHATTVTGPKETFVFTDESATDHTVRWMDVRFPLQETSLNLYGGMITLRKEV